MHDHILSPLGIAHPVIQAPMLGVTTTAMVAVVSEVGGLGSLPVGGLSADRTRQLIRETRQLTQRPFAVNLFTHSIPAVDVAQAEAMQDLLITLAARRGIVLSRTPASTLTFHSYEEQVAVLLSEQVSIVSFTFGMMSSAAAAAFRAADVTLMGTATCLREAQLLHAAGIDMIVAQGIEAGGHRGTFIYDEPLPEVHMSDLVSQIAASTGRPVIAAGGIYDGATARAAMQRGAGAVQIGSAFLACDESAAIPSFKDALLKSTPSDTTLTRAFSGRWARGLRNAMMSDIENSGLVIPSYPVQNSLTSLLRSLAQQRDDKDYTNLWAGWEGHRATRGSAADIMARLIAELGEWPYHA